MNTNPETKSFEKINRPFNQVNINTNIKTESLKKQITQYYRTEFNHTLLLNQIQS